MDKITLIQNPLDYIRLNVEEEIFVKCKGDREIIGVLDVYDNHLNMILSNARETYKQITIEDNEEIVKKKKKIINKY
ncbi:U6 snRNA-associated Sm-like protein LSm3, putative [Hepatocystis sp. ex Piliocolobus tephrosceles]|nr:U6 snRNA-associated Sm-like protein LSm3, putative [Hepatocystis sp. ex Piliocolobus tephrosceles]